MNQIRLAIADDHVLFRRGMASILKGAKGISLVMQAGNGQELVEMIQNTARDFIPEVILMDLKMPVMDGITATKFLKSRYPEIKIIVLSMHDEEKFIVHLVEAGAHGYLLKDAEPDEVEKAIRTVVREGHCFNENVTAVMMRKMVSAVKEKKHPEMLIPSSVCLTPRELLVLKMIREGFTTLEIGDKMCLSDRTIEGYRTRIMRKTDTKNSTEMVAFALKHKLLE